MDSGKVYGKAAETKGLLDLLSGICLTYTVELGPLQCPQTFLLSNYISNNLCTCFADVFKFLIVHLANQLTLEVKFVSKLIKKCTFKSTPRPACPCHLIPATTHATSNNGGDG